MTIGERIKKIRINAGLTQKQLAEKSGIAEQNIRRYELGKRKPKYETLQKIAEALGTNIGRLIGFIERDLFAEGEASVFRMQMKKGYSFTEQEECLIKHFSKLNETGQSKAIECIEKLTRNPEYQLLKEY